MCLAAVCFVILARAVVADFQAYNFTQTVDHFKKDLPALVMPNGAHHSETNLPSEDDTEDVIEARRLVGAHLRAWLSPSDSSGSRSAATTPFGVPSVTLMSAANEFTQLGAALGCAAAMLAMLLSLAVRRARAQTADDSQGARAPLLQSDLA